MYYFLAHGISAKGGSGAQASNTYLLALDGDVDFKPESVILLIDLMKRNPKVGAACGRIHPIGSGMLILDVTSLNRSRNGLTDYTIEWFSRSRCQRPCANFHTAETAGKDGGRMTLDLAILSCL